MSTPPPPGGRRRPPCLFDDGPDDTDHKIEAVLLKGRTVKDVVTGTVSAEKHEDLWQNAKFRGVASLCGADIVNIGGLWSDEGVI